MANIVMRQATIEDAALILGFITDLAIFENAEHEVKATMQDIETTLFGEEASAETIICLADNVPVGYAVYFFNYSTWLGKYGLYLEDLYVSPNHRGNGTGKALLKQLAQIACNKGCERFEWSVLDWNQSAIEVYESIGAKPQNEWIGYRLSGEALRKFAEY